MTKSKSETVKSGGISTLGAGILMTFTFLFLNLNGIIDWPWWAIMMPIFVALGLYAIAIVIAILVLLIALLVGATASWKKKQ